MFVEYTTEFWQEEGQVVGHAMPLDVMSCGDTRNEAEAALDEAVRIFVERAKEMGTLEEILSDCGYEFTSEGWTIPRHTDNKPRLLTMSA